jgi:hypothetical protein
VVDLAGFDVIVEFHVETIQDFVNLSPQTNPIDGKSIYLFGGPFSTDFSINLGAIGTMTARAIVDLDLFPQLHQPLALIKGTFDGGSMLAGAPSLHIGADFSILVPLWFTSVPSASKPNTQQPVFNFSGTSPSVTLDAPTASLADATMGPGGASALSAGLEGALAVFLGIFGTKAIATNTFSIVPGVDSADPAQVSALPQIAWIDDTTLGVFGYYRAAASGGNVGAKTSGDLTQAHEEYFYDAPPPFSIMPGRRAAMLLSAEAFRMVIGCPVARSVVANLVQRRELPSWVDWERGQEGDAIAQDKAAELVPDYLAELGKDPTADPQTLYDRARSDVHASVEEEIANRATARLSAWLVGSIPAGPESSGGQQMIAASTPPPCGQGTIEITDVPVNVPIVTSNFTPTLDSLDVELGAGQITATVAASGMLQVSLGDVYFADSGELDLTIAVDEFGRVTVGSNVIIQDPNVHGTGATGVVIDYVKSIFPGTWRDLMTFAAIVMKQQATQAISNTLSKGLPTLSMPRQPFETRMAQVTIDPDSLLAAVLICRQPRWNMLNPGLSVTATLDSRTAAGFPSLRGTLVLPATKWGCAAQEFSTLRTFWNESFSLRARLTDAPLPVTVLGWEMELGNFSWNSIANAQYIDPRPTWSGNPVPIVAGQVLLDGEVEHLEPLIYPELHGPLTHAQISVEVNGSADQGWEISISGTDGNFFLRISADVRDGDGKQWHGETFVTHIGDQLTLPPAYYKYRADCDAKYRSWERLWMSAHTGLVGIAPVAPGTPVMNGETLEAMAVQSMVVANDPGAMRALLAAQEQYGPSFLEHVGIVETPQTEGQALR